ncbi:diheme cytochrome c SoxD [Pseudovibrio sp. FO-BEG1]|uniref:Cytochrome c n=2 Tax=Pseudovibrio TaxID=258255 RepID=A0A1I7C305_9HYPH|nr:MULTISPECIES: cytochrome c family protein [Pseudovibrio]AEV35972.1 diheme cytochrome c SoxD [Pseudovibrio sp. FO-BEG1]EEA92446.1 cytochrome c2 [Pseudovibrio sp. JE062]QUS56802.1 cytochrome c family protein [Pseudovibrio brasiliensis]SFT93825.1 cytochrome c [Pseudovibrio denitrificans]
MKQFGVVAALALLVSTGAAFAEGDVAKGSKVFKKCKACHAVGEKAKNKVGPQLNGIVGAGWGEVEGYKYSKPLLAGKEEGKSWDEATLDAYLTKPKKVIPKGKMAFAGLKKEQQRQDVIAYLAQFNKDGSKK